MRALKRLAAHLSRRQQQLLKRIYFAWKIRSGRFRSEEPDYTLVRSLLAEGDWVLDIGANFGQYTLLFSSLVGARGRVFAFEPIPETFELLAANAQHFPFHNVTLLNVAASDDCGMRSMTVPASENGPNYYTARITGADGERTVFSCPVDALPMTQRVRLVKIDVEGHELAVLAGMKELLARDRPHLIVEASSPRLVEFLARFGYTVRRLPGSPNYVFRPQDIVRNGVRRLQSQGV
jgi:FkbM family methyltransferase